MSWNLGGTPPGMDPKNVTRVPDDKAPGDILPYTIDMTKPLSNVDDDVIDTNIQIFATSHRNDGQPSDLTIIEPFTVDDSKTRVTFWLANGSPDYEYLVSVTVTSVADQRLTRSFIVSVYNM